MATSSTYCLEGAGGTKLELSKDELRALLVRVEAELQRSDVYHKVLEGLQQYSESLGEMADGAQGLAKALGREAIRLVLRRLVRQSSRPALVSPVLTVVPNPRPISATDGHSLKAERNVQILSKDGNAGSAAPVNAIAPAASDRIVASPPANYAVATDSAPAGEITVASPAESDRAASESVLKQLPGLRQFQKVNQPPVPTFAEQREAALQKIGHELQSARLNRAISLEQLHNQTHIPIHQLRALEAGQVDHLPEDIYVRGFVRRIGDAIGLDGSALAASLPSLEPAKSIVPSWQRTSSTTPNQIRPVHLYVGYAALMAGATGGLMWMTQQPMFNGGLDEFPDLLENSAAQTTPEIDQYAPSQFNFNPPGSVSSPEMMSPEGQFDPERLLP